MRGKIRERLVWIGAAVCVAVFIVAGIAPFAGLKADRTTANGAATVMYPAVAPSTAKISDNWAGYLATGASGSFTSANGSWTVPSYLSYCPFLALHVTAVFWVGLDGGAPGSPTVEQTGTGMECRFGSVSYFGWFEFYPNPLRTWAMIVSPGDTVTASVLHSSGTFNLTLTDHSTGVYGWANRTFTKAVRSTAEWIAERPSYGGVLGRLPDFGGVVFRGCYATYLGTTLPIGHLSNLSKVWMDNYAHTQTMAQPYPLNGTWQGFQVRWISSGP
jgi:hypothetical protein